jgi:hypothetical protein
MGVYLEMLRVIKLVLYQDILVKNKGKNVNWRLMIFFDSD